MLVMTKGRALDAFRAREDVVKFSMEGLKADGGGNSLSAAVIQRAHAFQHETLGGVIAYGRRQGSDTASLQERQGSHKGGECSREAGPCGTARILAPTV